MCVACRAGDARVITGPGQRLRFVLQSAVHFARATAGSASVAQLRLRPLDFLLGLFVDSVGHGCFRLEPGRCCVALLLHSGLVLGTAPRNLSRRGVNGTAIFKLVHDAARAQKYRRSPLMPICSLILLSAGGAGRRFNDPSRPRAKKGKPSRLLACRWLAAATVNSGLNGDQRYSSDLQALVELRLPPLKVQLSTLRLRGGVRRKSTILIPKGCPRRMSPNSGLLLVRLNYTYLGPRAERIADGGTDWTDRYRRSCWPFFACPTR